MRKFLKHKFNSMKFTIFALNIVLIIMLISAIGVISFVQYSKVITEEMSQVNTDNTLKIGNSMEEIFRNVQNNALFLHQDPTVKEFLVGDNVEDAYIKLNQFIQNKLAYADFISGVMLIRLDGQDYISNSSIPEITSEIYNQLVELKGKGFVNTDIKSTTGRNEYISYSRVINDINDIGEPIGILQLYFDKNQILDLIDNDGMSEDSDVYIVEDHKIIISTVEKEKELPIDKLKEIISFDEKQETKIDKINNVPSLVISYKMNNINWSIVKIVPLTQIENQKKWVAELIIAFVLIVILISGIITFILAKWVFKPLELLSESMQNIELGNYDIYLPEEGYDEISVVSHSFNQMSKRIDELINRIYEVQLKEKDAQIKALQASISPHFIYNTLDTICWMSRMENAFETCNLIEALSTLFRCSVKDTSTISVKKELEHITSYIKIQECRYFGNIDFNIHVDESLLSNTTVGFTLQPLVENAIIHGIEPFSETGSVDIDIKSENGRLIFIVTNSGDIVDLVQLNEKIKYNSAGIGIQNVHERIRLYYGDDYGLTFKNNMPSGVKVIVNQPLIEYSKEGEK